MLFYKYFTETEEELTHKLVRQTQEKKHNASFHPLLSLCQYCLCNALVTSQLPLYFRRLRLVHTHPQMHYYWRDKPLSLPCCELFSVMSENLSHSVSCRVPLIFRHLVFNSELLSTRSCCVSIIFCFYFLFSPFFLSREVFFLFYFNEIQTRTHTNKRTHKCQWRIMLLTRIVLFASVWRLLCLFVHFLVFVHSADVWLSSVQSYLQSVNVI